MIITPDTMKLLFTGFKAVFNDAWAQTPTHAFDIAMKTSSGTSREAYPWLGQFPQLREWVGDRHIKSVETQGFFIDNLKFESTVTVKRESIEDDQYGVFAPMFRNMGRVARLHPDQLVFGLLKNGFNSFCFDGLPFFDEAHPAFDENGAPITASNMQPAPAGYSGPAWFLLDAKQAVKPLIFQERLPYDFQSVVSDTDSRVFLRDEYSYGIRARVNAGFGLWHMAFGSQAPLTFDNYAAARAAMQMLRGDQGGLLGVSPTLLVVPPALEAAGRTLLKASSVSTYDSTNLSIPAVPVTNIWFESADLIVTPFVA
ncbi:Mu-like prophage major head subunit gpT family protein [Rhodoblastus acidophilus]|uniref:Mu-like prophage major head subunit gpT family protein n=1 Tax=Candidatus Rhodoblastus alkanivorans TaxID=2954117 RepID=A0ABS9Z6G6_9HYPH|nr:Mu-like prophage major head subunit gpT family protein [Candidatus Rhodoblastus alkanivorans]MCI4680421.1 Mu-like prophage major head subunit gpT family protein [Candidatus Rhodoblastus alkanivorans]MCI4683216.1 Mu-like prophage major head subunit gpT family protein [Candidatus Rhodoblastus alkanivorans]MDI4640528.1 Mu-like prophage major head subunit gpT family protein [Rhodoblastus acidophilus]